MNNNITKDIWVIYLIWSISLLTLIISCKNSNKSKDVSTIRFENNPKELINLSDICDSIYYIPLETNSKCYINKIEKIKFFGDSIFIINQLFGNLKEILVFNINGKFIGNFGQIGPGPEEIESPRDIVKFNGAYLIWDRLKISEFDNQGNFKKKLFNAFFPGANFFIYSDKINLYHGTDFPGLISEFDFNGNLLKTYKPVDPNNISSTFQGENLNNINDEYHFFAPSLDTVWMFLDNQIRPKYVFDFMGEITLQTLFMKYSDKIPPEMAPILRANSPSYVLSFCESKNYIFLKYLKLNKQTYKLISKNKSTQIDFIKCNNNIDNGLFGTPISVSNEYFVISLEPIQILNRRDIVKKSGQSAFRIPGQTIKDNDNPILMLVKFNF